jgi:hypothetical protein
MHSHRPSFGCEKWHVERTFLEPSRLFLPLKDEAQKSGRSEYVKTSPKVEANKRV